MKLIPKRRFRLLVLVGLLLIAALSYFLLGGLTWDDIRDWPRVYTTSSAFHDTIQEADRLVVRGGGFDCCGRIREENVLFEITDPAELESIRANLQFVVLTNAQLGACMCCGFPAMDWYKGRKRIALTAVQHGHAIRWKGFSAGDHWPGCRYAGDAPLTSQSAIWLTEWLIAQGVSNSDYSTNRLEKMKEFANKEMQAILR